MTEWFARYAETVGFSGTLVFTFLGAWAAFQQARLIFKYESARALSTTFLWFGASYFAAGLVYGLDRWLPALIIHGAVRSASSLPILIGHGKHHRYSRYEQVIRAIFIITPVVMALSPGKETFYLTMSFLGMGTYLLQPWRIIRDDTAGVVEIRVHFLIFLSAAFWALYGFATEDAVLRITGVCFTLLGLFTTVLIVVYRRRDRTKGIAVA